MEVSVSTAGLDPEWDRFLETSPDGCYQQSSLWAKAQEARGWKHVRFVVRDQGNIVGGAQMFLRSVPLGMAAGYISRGPVVASTDPKVREFILDQLDRIARQHRILFLKIQPAAGCEDLAHRLIERGACPSLIGVTPLATICVDLRQDPDNILALMHHKTRYNIRRAERKGLIVRQGTEADLPLFFNLVQFHGQQHGYYPGSEKYQRAMWATLSPADHFSFFLVEYEGKPLAAATFMLFGDVMANKVLADNGEHRDLNPQSILHWQVMLWAKQHGATWYDFGGIKLDMARAIVNDEPLPDDIIGKRTHFKTSFGGQVLIRPTVCDVSFVWPRKLTIRLAPALLKIRPLLSSLIGGQLAKYVQMHDRYVQMHDRAGKEMAANLDKTDN